MPKDNRTFITGNEISEIEPLEIRDDLTERSFEDRRYRLSKLPVPGLEQQQRKLDDVSIAEVKVDPEAKPEIASGQDKEDVTFVKTGRCAVVQKYI